MSNFKIKEIAFYSGVIALLVGAVVFTLSWTIFGGGMPEYRFFLFPGNLVLSMFTEEIDFWLKLVLLLIGQFGVVTTAVAVALKIYGSAVRPRSK